MLCTIHPAWVVFVTGVRAAESSAPTVGLLPGDMHPAWVIIVTVLRRAEVVPPYGGIDAVYHLTGLGGYRYLGHGRFVNRPYGVIVAASVFS